MNKKIGRPLRGGRGLKCVVRLPHGVRLQSPPSRGAWIEIGAYQEGLPEENVAPFAGGVD